MKNKEMAELFKTIADSFTRLSEIYSSVEAAEPSPVEESATEGNTEPVTYTKEESRAKLAQMSKAEAGKYKADVKGIVAKYSSDGTLSGIPADKYADVVAALEVVGNA